MKGTQICDALGCNTYWTQLQKLLLNTVKFVRFFGGRLQIYTILIVHQ